jgi:hypothetical protein
MSKFERKKHSDKAKPQTGRSEGGWKNAKQERDQGDEEGQFDNDDDGAEDDSEGEGELDNISIAVRICLWEFGQNDPKR